MIVDRADEASDTTREFKKKKEGQMGENTMLLDMFLVFWWVIRIYYQSVDSTVVIMDVHATVYWP